MRRGHWRMVLALVMVLSFLLPMSALAENPFDDTHSLWASLSGSNEVTPGDPDGFGFAKVTIDIAAGALCYRLSVAGTESPVAAHIHEGVAGTNGPVVVPFTAPVDGLIHECVEVETALLESIVANPAGYYVNIHTPTYAPGAVRGQLMMNDGSM